MSGERETLIERMQRWNKQDQILLTRHCHYAITSNFDVLHSKCDNFDCECKCHQEVDKA